MKGLMVVLGLVAAAAAARADSLNCREVGFHDTPLYAVVVAVAGNYACVADVDSGLRVISVSDPAHPTEVGYYDSPGRAYGVAVAGDYAYVADGDSGLRVVSVSDPAYPTEVGYCDTPGYALDVAVAGNHAYVADSYDGGLRVISISDPSQSSEVGYYETRGSAIGVDVAGGYAYVADGGTGIRVIEFFGGVGVEEQPDAEALMARCGATIICGSLRLADGAGSGELLDATGRSVVGLKPGASDVSHLGPGVYFVEDTEGGVHAMRKVVITR